MKKFIAKLLLLIMPIIGLFICVNYLYKNTNYFKQENHIDKFNYVPKEISLANLGSSHGEVHFIYDDFPEYTTFNFGVSGQTHEYNYAILKQYIKNFKRGAIVIIPISYFEIIRIVSKCGQKAQRPRYYRFVKRKYMQEVDEWKYIDYIKFNCLPVLSTKNALHKIRFDIPDEKYDAWIYKRTEYLNETKLNDYCKKKYNNWTDENERGEEGFNYNFNLVCKIIDLCKQHDLVPVLVTTPITDVLNSYYENHPTFSSYFYRFTEELVKKYQGLYYFDYSHDEDFSPNHELFTDGDHLNIYGAKKITDTVIKDLKHAGLLQ